MSDNEGWGYFPESTPPPPIERYVAPEEDTIEEFGIVIEDLRGALAFYASHDVYEMLIEDLGVPPVLRDGGKLARRVLGWE